MLQIFNQRSLPTKAAWTFQDASQTNSKLGNKKFKLLSRQKWT